MGHSHFPRKKGFKISDSYTPISEETPYFKKIKKGLMTTRQFIPICLFLLVTLFSFAACGKDDELPLLPKEPANETPDENDDDQNGENDNQNNKINLNIGEYVFAVTLYDNASAKAFKALLPLSVTMNEMNGNEKYHYLSVSLPTSATIVGTACNGDLMLYGNNCVVLFYQTFATSYSYTKLGKIDNAVDLASVLGNGNVAVTLEMAQ